jgi:hypothetical protein
MLLYHYSSVSAARAATIPQNDGCCQCWPEGGLSRPADHIRRLNIAATVLGILALIVSVGVLLFATFEAGVAENCTGTDDTADDEAWCPDEPTMYSLIGVAGWSSLVLLGVVGLAVGVRCVQPALPPVYPASVTMGTAPPLGPPRQHSGAVPVPVSGALGHHGDPTDLTFSAPLAAAQQWA